MIGVSQRLKIKRGFLWLTLFCLMATGIGIYVLGGLDPERIQQWLQTLGIWAPITYIVLYAIATLLILPSTPLNISGGVLFGLGWGTLWTSIAAIVAAIVAFWFTRTLGRQWVQHHLSNRWQAIDAEISQGGLFYLCAIRLLPIIPYGLVNFAAGLTAISPKDYLLATAIGTVPGIFPFVMMGAGLTAMTQGELWPLMLAFTLIGLLIGVATWYRRQRQSPQAILRQREQHNSTQPRKKNRL